jgi:hypothetical protein
LDGQHAFVEIEVLHPQLQALEQPESAAVQELDHEVVWIRELFQHGVDFLAGKDQGIYFDYVPSAGWAQKNFSVEIQQAIDSKNQKRIYYSDSYTEHWLLIISEGTGPSSFFDLSGVTREVLFESRFDRNFFMEAFL